MKYKTQYIQLATLALPIGVFMILSPGKLFWLLALFIALVLGTYILTNSVVKKPHYYKYAPLDAYQ